MKTLHIMTASTTSCGQEYIGRTAGLPTPPPRGPAKAACVILHYRLANLIKNYVIYVTAVYITKQL